MPINFPTTSGLAGLLLGTGATATANQDILPDDPVKYATDKHTFRGIEDKYGFKRLTQTPSQLVSVAENYRRSVLTNPENKDQIFYQYFIGGKISENLNLAERNFIKEYLLTGKQMIPDNSGNDYRWEMK